MSVRGRVIGPALIGFLLVGCTGGGSLPADRGDPARATVRVASFDFPESRVLAEIYATALQVRGYPVTRTLGLGSREVVEPALEQGLVDLVPEYAGSALRFLQSAAVSSTSPAAAESPVTTAVADAATSLSAALGERGLVALAFAAAEDQNGVAVTAATATARGLHQVSDLVPIASSLAFGGPPECPERPFCLAGLRDRYDLRFRVFLPMPSRQITAEALLGAEIDVGMLETTDPHLGDGRIVHLADDRGLQPAENVVPVVRRQVAERYGSGLADVLNAVSAKLTTAGVVELNRRVVLAGAPADRVAADWLRSNGLG